MVGERVTIDENKREIDDNSQLALVTQSSLDLIMLFLGVRNER